MRLHDLPNFVLADQLDDLLYLWVHESVGP
jgi:hypothetical protein